MYLTFILTFTLPHPQYAQMSNNVVESLGT